MKKKLFYILFILVIFCNITLISNINVYAVNITSENIELVVLFNDNNIDENVKNIITSSGGTILHDFPELGGIEVRCKPDLIPIIKEQSSVKSLSPIHNISISREIHSDASQVKNYVKYSSYDLYDQYQWDIKRVTNDGQSFDLATGNHDVVVGIIDSGIDKDHMDLYKNYLGGQNLVPAGFGNDPYEKGDIDDIEDRMGHGTGVAGIIAANGRTKGIAPDMGFKSYRIFNKYGDTNAVICSSAVISAINDGVKVINLSISSYDFKGKCFWTDSVTGKTYNLGDDMADYSLLKRAIKYAIKNNIVVVAASGNDGLDCAKKDELTNYLNSMYGSYGFKYIGLTYEAPGSIKGVITVSATNKNDTIAAYSNYGEDFIDISAPGGEGTEDDICFTTAPNSSYGFTAGTSIAAPKVSALVALIISKDPNITPKKVLKKIYKTADKKDNSKYYGNGIINVYNTLKTYN